MIRPSRVCILVCFAALYFAGMVLPAFAQTVPPSIDSILPSQGPVAGGTIVVITGTGFTPDSTVRFNRNAGLNVQFQSTSQLQVTTPPLGDGPFATALSEVHLSNAAGGAYTEFLYLPPAFAEIGIGDITTIAGVGNFVGDGRLATQALIEAEPIAIDAAGNIYEGEETGGRVREIDHSSGRITTIAGTGVIGFSGDGGPATDAEFNWPVGLAVDRLGNVYVADAVGNNRVRKINVSTGFVSTIAGTGKAGYSGDGGPATQAQLNTSAASVVVDNQGNVYVVDVGNERVRKIDTAGIITTVAGNGATGFSGDGGPATQASFNLGFEPQVTLLALDSQGNLYLNDFGNLRVRRIGSDGVVTTVVGGGHQSPSEGLLATQSGSGINGVAVDQQDRVLWTDANRIWRVEKTGVLTLLAGSTDGTAGLSPDGVLARGAPMIALYYMAVDSSGNTFVSERSARRIRRIDATTGLLSTVAGIGPDWIGDAESAALAAVFGDVGNLSIDAAGNILVVDGRGSLRIRKINPAGAIVTLAGNGLEAVPGTYYEGAPALSAGMAPVSVERDSTGNIFFTDFCSVRRVGTDGLIRTIVGPLTNIQMCGFAGDGGPGTSALTSAEQNVIKLDGQGNIYIADTFNRRVRRWDRATGVITTIAGSGPASDLGGNDSTPDGGFAGDGGPATQALLSDPTDVALDSRRNICIPDTGNFSVRCVDAQGIIRTVAGRGTAYPGDGGLGSAAVLNPYRIAFDQTGNMYISDAADGSIRKLDANGIISTVAGIHGSRGFSGDGGPALRSQIDYGSGLAVDAHGNVLLFDGNNRRIRVIKEASTIGPIAINLDQHGLTGSWYNPATGGQGFEIEVYPDVIGPGQGVLFAGWFTYDATAAGGRRWYGLQGTVSSASPTATLPIFDVEGGNLNAPPSRGANGALGSATLQFSDCNTGTLSYNFTDGSGRSGTIPIVRLTPDLECTPSGANGNEASAYLLSGDWFDPTTSGQGFIFDFSPSINNVFAAWYTFKPNGQQIGGPASQDWYTLQSNKFVVGITSLDNIPIVETTGGKFDNPASTTSAQVGTANVAFQSCSAMTLSYVFTGGENKGLSGAINLQRVGPTPAGCSL